MKNLTTISLGIACATVALSAQASIVNLSTGADVGADGSDKNWTLVTPTQPTRYTPVIGDRPAYVVLDNGAFPFNGYWARDNSDPYSRWITYSSQLETGGDAQGHTYDYQLSFTSPGGSFPINWICDNSSALFVDGVLVGTRSGEQEYRNWLSSPLMLNLDGGNHVIDILVDNWPQSSGNPSGLRVNFVAPVPEPGTVLAAALLVIPLGVGVFRGIRRKG